MRGKAVLVSGALVLTFLAAGVVGASSARAQQERERMAQKLEEMFPPTPKPPVEMKCPPAQDYFSVTREFTEKQNLCLRAGRPFYLEAKQDFRLCTQTMPQCPRNLQVDIYVHQGSWVKVLERKQGMVFVEYDYTPLATGAHSYVSGYADATNLQAPKSTY